MNVSDSKWIWDLMMWRFVTFAWLAHRYQIRKSRRANMLCADCNLHNASSVLSNIVPQLPQHPGFKGKFIKPFYSLFRSPDRLDRITTFKVSVSVFTRLTDISRYGFDTATLTVGSMYPMESFGSIWRWLHGMGMSQVSASAVSCSTDICRLGFDVATLTDGSIDHARLFGVI